MACADDTVSGGESAVNGVHTSHNIRPTQPAAMKAYCFCGPKVVATTGCLIRFVALWVDGCQVRLYASDDKVIQAPRDKRRYNTIHNGTNINRTTAILLTHACIFCAKKIGRANNTTS